jgi:hypothetical protein
MVNEADEADEADDLHGRAHEKADGPNKRSPRPVRKHAREGGGKRTCETGRQVGRHPGRHHPAELQTIPPMVSAQSFPLGADKPGRQRFAVRLRRRLPACPGLNCDAPAPDRP